MAEILSNFCEARTQNAEGEVKDRPTAAQYRDIFGMRDTRKIGNHGIGILNLAYKNERLLDLRKHSHGAEVLFSFSDQDISNISVKHPFLEKWTTVDCTFEGLEGVTLAEWMENLRYVKKRFGRMALHNREQLLEGLRAVREASNQSKLVAGISSPYLTAKDIRHFEQKELASFQYSEPQNIDRGDGSTHHLQPPPSMPDDDPFNPVGTFPPIPDAEPIVGHSVQPKIRSKLTGRGTSGEDPPPSTEPQSLAESEPTLLRPDEDPDSPTPQTKRRPLRIEKTSKKD